MERWTRRELFAASIFLLCLAMMIIIPLVQLRVSYQTREIARFGWQMYAHDHGRPSFTAKWPDGRTQAVQSRYPWAPWWGDFGFREALIHDICEQATGATSITARKEHMTGFLEEYKCP